MSSSVALPGSSLKRWLIAMRLPFTTVALAPFAVGVYLAHAHGTLLSPAASGAGLLAVLLICVGCYLTGEISDQREDLLTLQHGRSKFAGGTLLVAQGELASRAVARVVVLCFLGALALGLVVATVHRAPWLFALGLFGAASALLYSLPPVRLVSRGLGELLIAVCYGWLTLVTGYASAAGALPPHSLSLALPMALTIFNVILINELPDYEADAGAGKRNLLQRVGKPAGVWIYALSNLATAAALIALWLAFRPGRLDLLFAVVPAALLALGLAVSVALLGLWRVPAAMEKVCGLSIVLNLLASIEVGVLARWS